LRYPQKKSADKMAARFAALVIVAHVAQVAECANLKGAAPSEKASMMGAMMEGMIATMKAATPSMTAPVQELSVPVAPMVAGEDLSDGNINDAFSKAMAITEDEDLLDDPIALPVAQHVKAVAVATMPNVATSSVQLGMFKKALAAEQAVNEQLELKVGAEEKKIRAIQKQAVRKIKTLKSEVLGLKARLGVAPPAPLALVVPAVPVVVAAPVVAAVAIEAPIAASAAPVAPVAAAAPPPKSMAALMNLFAKVQGDAISHTMHTKLKAGMAQNHLNVVKAMSRAQTHYGHPHEGFRGIIKHEVAPPQIKFKFLHVAK